LNVRRGGEEEEKNVCVLEKIFGCCGLDIRFSGGNGGGVCFFQIKTTKKKFVISPKKNKTKRKKKTF
ncbi:hypothetical protein M5Y76_10560, partial [Neisseria meningitidis]|nr:hypothetical protein [Neisseria meningitidis]